MNNFVGSIIYNSRNSLLSSWDYPNNWNSFFYSFVKFPFYPITI